MHKIALAGLISGSGATKINGVAGPRQAIGTGRFTKVKGVGKWNGTGPSGTARAFGPPFAPEARFFFALPASGLLERVFARGLTASSGVVPAEAGITKPVCLFFVQLYFAIISRR